MTPVLKLIDGIRIDIRSREHLPPHIHAHYSGQEALIEIRTGIMFEGEIPPKKLRIVQNFLNEEGMRERVEEIFYDLNPKLRP